MSAKYYTQFILTDAEYRGGNEFCGVVELNHPMAQDSDRAQSAVKLVSWSRLH